MDKSQYGTEPAFPSHGTMGEIASTGICVRDLFAILLASGYMANSEASFTTTDRALWSYQLADEMLRIRLLDPHDLGLEIKAAKSRFVI